MTKDEALRMALGALDSKYTLGCGVWRSQQNKAIAAIKEALAALVQEPIKQWRQKHSPYWYDGYPDNNDGGGPYETRTLYTTPPAAQPEQEPVAWMDADGNVSDNNDHNCFPIPLYTTANIQSYLEKDNLQPEQEQNEFELRGKLATLLCWHRLTQAEQEDLLRFTASPYGLINAPKDFKFVPSEKR